MGQKFIAGLELAHLFYKEQVKPILYQEFPKLKYSAAKIGSGSEVLGFDDEMSTDHHWGPHVMLFLKPQDYIKYKSRIMKIMCQDLPVECHGYPTNFSSPDPLDHGTQLLSPIKKGPVNHRVEVFTLKDYFNDYLNYDITKKINLQDWLSFPQQKLRTITAGKVFHDDLGLNNIRHRFKYYPKDLWYYLLSSAWNNIGQDEHLMGRAGLVHDDLGSSLIGSKIVHTIINLCFLMEKQYIPYNKWIGTGFSKLSCAKKMKSILLSALYARNWKEREKYLCKAYVKLLEIHNQLKITKPILKKPVSFFGRPFKVIKGEDIANIIKEKIKDPKVLKFSGRSLIGNLDLFCDCTDLLCDSWYQPYLKTLWEG